MTPDSKPAEDLRDGNVFFAPDNEMMWRVHRVRKISCFGQPFVELLVRNVDMPCSSLVHLIYEPRRLMPLAIDRK